MKPLVSVIMPVYNGQKYLNAAIDSILNQSYENFEFLIVDDGSKDESKKIIQSYGDSRVHLIENEVNLGVAKSLNKAIEESKGTYICRMDADDIALPIRLETQVKYLNLNDDISMCGSWVKTFGELDSIFKYPQGFEDIQVALLFYPCFAHPAVMWRREDFVKNDLFYQFEPPTAEDYDLWARASDKLTLSNIPEILLDYRIDMQVKHSPYLKQQTEGNWLVKKSLLSKLGIEISEDFKWTLLNFTGVDVECSKSREHLLKFLDLILSISRVNRDACVYEQRKLDVFLRDNLYGFFFRNRELNIRDWFRYRLVSESFPATILTLKLILKRFLKRTPE